MAIIVDDRNNSKYNDNNNNNINKKNFWEILIDCFLMMGHGLHRERRYSNSYIVICIFVAYKPSHCLVTIGGIHRRTNNKVIS